MKEFIKKHKVLSVVTLSIIVLAVIAIIFQRSYAFNGASGTSGTCNWDIDSSGKMIIEPQQGQTECTLQNQNGSYDSSPWYSNRTNITNVEVKQGVKANTNASYLFYNLTNATLMDLSNLDTSKVTNMQFMFYNCRNLTNLDLSTFNTSNVIIMAHMFWGCSSLINLDLSNFDTSKVTSMRQMFQNCSSLQSLDVTNFNTSNVTDMVRMFSGCSSLTSLDVTKFDTNKVTDMRHMFWGCSNLTSLDVTKFDTSKVTDMVAMFESCRSLTNLDVTNFDTSNVRTMNYMFNECSSLTSLNVTNFNTSNVTDMQNMFNGCNNLNSLDLSNFDTSNVTVVTGMFNNIGSNKNEGTKLKLNNTFSKTYATDSDYSFPYSYYTKETNGNLDNRLYTLEEMKTATTGSSTPTTWVPAYQVNYDKGSGDSVSGTTPQIYRIGSKINTNGLLGVKNKYDFTNWNTSSDGTGTSINKNGISASSYGDKYASVGTNNVLTLYGQYEKQEESIATDMDVTRIVRGAPSKVTNEFTYSITPDSNNPASVSGIPSTFKITFNNESSTSGVAQKGININFDEAVYTKPGDYKFTVQETGSTDSTTYPLSRDKWEVSVSVRYRQSGGSPTSDLIVKSVVMEKVGETNKDSGMTFESESKLTNISIFHKVEGNMADIEKYFKIKVTINGETGDEYTITGLDTSGVTYEGESVTNPTKFVVGQENYIYLKHNQGVVIGEKSTTGNSTNNEIKSGTTYRIEEDNTGEAMLYETYINESSTNSKDSGNLEANINAAENDNLIINTYNADTMTGKFLKVLPYIGIVLVAIIGIVFMTIRKMRYKEEE